MRLERRHGWRVEPSWIVYLPGVVRDCTSRHASSCRRRATCSCPVRCTSTSSAPPSSRRAGSPKFPCTSSSGAGCSTPMSFEEKQTCSSCATPRIPAARCFGAWSSRRSPRRPASAHRLRRDPLRSRPRCRPRPRADREPFARSVAAYRDADVREQDLQLSGRGLRVGDHRGRAAARAFAAELVAHVLHAPSVFGYEATLAAFRDGDGWLAAQLEYLRGNRDLVERTLNLPMAHVEATYLAWIDCSPLGIESAYEFSFNPSRALTGPAIQRARAFRAPQLRDTARPARRGALPDARRGRTSRAAVASGWRCGAALAPARLPNHWRGVRAPHARSVRGAGRADAELAHVLQRIADVVDRGTALADALRDERARPCRSSSCTYAGCVGSARNASARTWRPPGIRTWTRRGA